MRCGKCRTENETGAKKCSNCGADLPVETFATVRAVPRKIPAGEKQLLPAYVLCPRCGMPTAMGDAICRSCRWEIQKPFHRTSPSKTGSCMGTILMRVGTFLVSSIVSAIVGGLAAALGIGATVAGILSGLISTILSIIPPVLSWILRAVRPSSTAS